MFSLRTTGVAVSHGGEKLGITRTGTTQIADLPNLVLQIYYCRCREATCSGHILSSDGVLYALNLDPCPDCIDKSSLASYLEDNLYNGRFL